MTDIATALKSEISRLARKELRKETTILKKAVAAHRSEIAELKRRVQEQAKELKQLGKARASGERSDRTELPTEGLRFSAKGLASLRKRWSLSAEQCGLLIGASSQSVYNWEQGKTKPRAEHLPAIAALRRMGKREIAARLAVQDDQAQ